MTAEQHAADSLIAAVLRGEAPAWPQDATPALIESILFRCSFHGVEPLMHLAVAQSGWPENVKRPLQAAAARCAMWEEDHLGVVSEVLGKLHENALTAVVFKGTALAYDVYTDAVHRPRTDTDLLVPEAELPQVHALLVRMGFGRISSGSTNSSQASYLKAGRFATHALDVHWKINNSQVLSKLFAADELAATARCVTTSRISFRAPRLADSMLIASVHRRSHANNPIYLDDRALAADDRLIWHYDVHLLAQRFGPDDWRELVAKAASKDLRHVCLEGLEAAALLLGSSYPDWVGDELRKGPRREAAAGYLASGRLRQLWLDIAAQPTWGARARHIRALALPAPAYMRKKYRNDRSPLSWLYARRAAQGIGKLFAPRGGAQ